MSGLGLRHKRKALAWSVHVRAAVDHGSLQTGINLGGCELLIFSRYYCYVSVVLTDGLVARLHFLCFLRSWMATHH